LQLHKKHVHDVMANLDLPLYAFFFHTEFS